MKGSEQELFEVILGLYQSNRQSLSLVDKGRVSRGAVLVVAPSLVVFNLRAKVRS